LLAFSDGQRLRYSEKKKEVLNCHGCFKKRFEDDKHKREGIIFSPAVTNSKIPQSFSLFNI